jgi:hypothetical protein
MISVNEKALYDDRNKRLHEFVKGVKNLRHSNSTLSTTMNESCQIVYQRWLHSTCKANVSCFLNTVNDTINYTNL